MHEFKLAAFLLFIFFILSASAVFQKSLTADEIIHIPAGASYVSSWDFRLNPEHPPLVKLLSGLFMFPFSPVVPFDDASWSAGDQKEFGRVFFFKANRDRHDLLLFVARLPAVLLGMLLGLVVFLWARDLYGVRGGLLALSLYVFCPNFLGHSGLVTTDVPVSAFLVLSVFLVWRWLRKKMVVVWKDCLVLGVVFGLTLGAKFTGVYVVPVVGVIFLFHVIRMWKKEKKLLARRVVVLALSAFVGMIVISALYGFADVWTFVEGLQRVVRESGEGRNAFLFGEYGRGWWYYFPLAFVVKMPIPSMVLFGFALFFVVRKRALGDELFLLIPFVLLFGVFMLNTINIGFRHVFPALPFLFVLAGSLAKQRVIIARHDVLKAVIVVLLVWLVVGALWVFPDFLAFFNEFAGGPGNGHKFLMDSNIDWGQDLRGVRSWMERYGVEKVTLGYWGADDAEFRGIPHNKLKCYQTQGILVVSVNILNGFREEDRACTEWLHELTPFDFIGYSLRVYNITSGDDKARGVQEYCENGCGVRCEKQERNVLLAVVMKNKCLCECA